MGWRVAISAACVGSVAFGATLGPVAEVALPPDNACAPLPAAKTPLPFKTGEVLDYDLDALGAQAGKMRISVRPLEEGALPIRAEAKTNTLFSKIRRVTGTATSYLNPKTLKPVRYYEDATENEIRKTANAQFRAEGRQVDLDWTWGKRSGKTILHSGTGGLDLLGTIFLVRALPWKVDDRVCFDVYAIRRMWRVVGVVEEREHVSLPLGEFDAWHLHGVAIRLDDPTSRRELHTWISDDAKRLPLAAIGTIDLGAVRATLNGVSRPGEKRVRGENPKETLKW